MSWTKFAPIAPVLAALVLAGMIAALPARADQWARTQGSVSEFIQDGYDMKYAYVEGYEPKRDRVAMFFVLQKDNDVVRCGESSAHRGTDVIRCEEPRAGTGPYAELPCDRLTRRGTAH